MSAGRGEDAWSRTAALLSLTFNMNRDSKKEKARPPSFFNPHSKENKRKAGQKVRVVEDLGELKHLFVSE